jgi:hypothetical protein
LQFIESPELSTSLVFLVGYTKDLNVDT